MKQVAAALLAVAVMTIAASVAAPAAATSADPVAALKSRISAGKGVAATDTTYFVELAGRTKISTRQVTLQYGKAGFAASDVSYKVVKQDQVDALLENERIITIGKVSYRKGGIFASDLPKGKTWAKTARPMPTGLSGMSSQPVNAAEPETLKALISSGKRSGRTYTGTIAINRLWKVSPWARSSFVDKKDDELITYKLTLGSNNLPVRLVTTMPAEGHLLGRNIPGDEVTHETVYRGWGGKYSIKAPPASQVYSGKK
ncbi:hypothetical protein OIE66_40020 [Nonomuraea sp. NBC_01738]|uniref:hypothetical protein n=1 Tax=Nonomuraea sp. NBC_01738 TaxID=2976003 RepID=UPI002E10C082|nr:hypothetical protein OIE66_40020 [Nonomuraea sp. NBC_01738]